MPFLAYSTLFYLTSGFFLKLLLIFLFTINLIAQDDYSVRVAYGTASTKDMGEILFFNPDTHPDNLNVLSLDVGYLLVDEMFELPLDLYVKGGLSYFDETDKHIYKTSPYTYKKYNAQRSDVLEGTIYVKIYYNIDFLDNRIRLGLGEGLSYTSSVLWTEEDEAVREGEEYSKFLNYMDISVDVDLGRLINYKPLKNTYIGWTLKHRSGIFGLFNGVNGGSNYNTISIERNF